MRILQHTLGLWSVAFAPDGTLFVLTERRGQLWAHPAGGAARILVAEDERLDGMLEVSPDGQWVAVSGSQRATVFRIGSYTPQDTASRSGLGWGRHTFPDTRFYQPGHFTGDSSAWVGRTSTPARRSLLEYHGWQLPEFTPFSLPAATEVPCRQWAAVPGTSRAVLAAWIADLKAVGVHRVDVAQPNRPAELLGTVEDCTNLTIGPDGRLFASDRDRRVRVYTPRAGALRLDLSVSFPAFDSSPHVVVSADGRLVARAFRNKLVYAADTTTGEVFGPWDWKIGRVNGVAIAPDGLTAAAAGSNKKVAVWDLE